MINKNTVLNEFEQWCDSMNEDCPVICLDALALLKEQDEERAKAYKILTSISADIQKLDEKVFDAMDHLITEEESQ